jgi:hypothetical protein
LRQQQDQLVGSAAAVAAAQQQQRKAVDVRSSDADEGDLVPSGLWPTLSFGLVPVRISPSRGNQQQQQPAYATGRA